MSVYSDKLLETSLWDKFLSAIKSPTCQYISFDLFDTVFYRDCDQPEEIFDRVGQAAFESGLIGKVDASKFRLLRITAEQKAKTNSSHEDVTLIKIYQQLDFISREKQRLLYNLELDEENKSLKLDPFIGKMLKQIINNGKKLLFLSDIYLPEVFLLQKLNRLTKLKISKEQLFVSSEIGLCKITGNLFPFVQKKFKAKSEQFLHIGDNYNSDYIGAVQSGWQAIHYNNVKQTNIPDSVQLAIKSIIDQLKEQGIKKVFIYGAGQFMQELEPELLKNSIKVLGITDSKADAGEYFIGKYRVQSLNSLNISINDTFVVASSIFKGQIVSTIKKNCIYTVVIIES